jgi:MFS family permease
MKPFQLNKEQRNYYLFIIGQFVSQFGSRITSYGLVLWSYKQTGSVLSMSLIAVCYLVPEVLLSFLSGSISDRWNKKKILLASDMIAALFSMSVILMLFTNTLRLEYLYIINFFLGVTDSFQNPASEVTISLIVPKEDYLKTSGIRSFFASFIGVFAPIVATTLYAFCGLKAIVMIDLATFVFAFTTLAAGVHIPHVTNQNQERLPLISQCIFGLRYLINNKKIFSLVLFMAFVNLIAAIYNTNLAPMVLSRNGNNEVQLGIVSSAISIAGLIGSVLVTKLPAPTKRVPLIINIMIFSFLFCNGLLGVGRNYYMWTLAVFGGNLMIPLLTANVEYFMRTRTPIELQGRVFAARNTLQYTSIPIGNLLGGLLADRVFIPYANESKFPGFLEILVGGGSGGGLGLLYLMIALIGLSGCLIFRRDRNFHSLDQEL